MVVQDINCDLMDEDESGYVWTFLREARDPGLIEPERSWLPVRRMLLRSPRSWRSSKARGTGGSPARAAGRDRGLRSTRSSRHRGRVARCARRTVRAFTFVHRICQRRPTSSDRSGSEPGRLSTGSACPRSGTSTIGGIGRSPLDPSSRSGVRRSPKSGVKGSACPGRPRPTRRSERALLTAARAECSRSRALPACYSRHLVDALGGAMRVVSDARFGVRDPLLGVWKDRHLAHALDGRDPRVRRRAVADVSGVAVMGRATIRSLIAV